MTQLPWKSTEPAKTNDSKTSITLSSGDVISFNPDEIPYQYTVNMNPNMMNR